MAYAIVTGDTATEITDAISINGVNYPLNILELWTSDELQGLGIYWITEPDAPGAFAEITGRTLTVQHGLPVRVATIVETPNADVATAICARLDAIRDAKIAGGFTYNGHTYQSAASDQTRLQGAAQLAFMAKAAGAQAGNYRWSNPNSDFTWIAADNTRVTMDVNDVLGLFQAGAVFETTLVFACRAKKDWVIDPARTRAELLAFDPTAGWPY